MWDLRTYDVRLWDPVSLAPFFGAKAHDSHNSKSNNTPPLSRSSLLENQTEDLVIVDRGTGNVAILVLTYNRRSIWEFPQIRGTLF